MKILNKKLLKWTLLILAYAGIISLLTFCSVDRKSCWCAEDPCPVVEVQPPVLCDEELSEAVAYGRAWAISQHETYQECRDGTGVMWTWDGTTPIYKWEAWAPICSYGSDIAQLIKMCLVIGDPYFCREYANRVNERIDCIKENNNENISRP